MDDKIATKVEDLCGVRPTAIFVGSTEWEQQYKDSLPAPTPDTGLAKGCYAFCSLANDGEVTVLKVCKTKELTKKFPALRRDGVVKRYEDLAVSMGGKLLFVLWVDDDFVALRARLCTMLKPVKQGALVA